MSSTPVPSQITGEGLLLSVYKEFSDPLVKIMTGRVSKFAMISSYIEKKGIINSNNCYYC